MAALSQAPHQSEHPRWADGHQCLLQGSPVEELHLLKHPIDHTHVEVHTPIQAGAKAVDEADLTMGYRATVAASVVTGKLCSCSIRPHTSGPISAVSKQLFAEQFLSGQILIGC